MPKVRRSLRQKPELGRLSIRLVKNMVDREHFYQISSAHDSTLIAQVRETHVFRPRQYFLTFEKLTGECVYVPHHPEQGRLTLTMAASSLLCRDASLRASQQRRVTACARDRILQAHQHPEIHFASAHMTAKALRGVAVEGTLSVRETRRSHRVNLVFMLREKNHLEIEGDSLLQLSAFDLPLPSSRWGLVRANDPVLLHWRLHARLARIEK